MLRFSKFDKHHHPIDKLADVNAIFNGLALLPQLVKAIHSGRTSDLSPVSFGILFICNLIWLTYGIHRKALPMILSSCPVILISGSILVLITVQNCLR